MIGRSWIAVSAAVALLGAPGVARAAGGGSYQSAPVTTAPILDGILNPAEWGNAPSYALSFGGIPATVQFEHDATNLYVAIVVSDVSVSASPLASIFFDNNDDGVSQPGDDSWSAGPGISEDFHLNATADSYANDFNSAGTNETQSGVSVAAGGGATFELSHPLCSQDASNDLCVATGGTLGIDFQYERQGGGLEFWNAPGPNLFQPVNNWAELTVGADTTAPVVSVTSPSAGTAMTGLVGVTASASDNVGVDHVVFSYFDGTKEYVIGSDATAPYSVQFDTTAFPDRETGAATVYARAFDAAGNATKVGNGIGIANGSPPHLGTVHGALDVDYVFLQDFWPNTSVSVNIGGTPATVTTDATGAATIAPVMDLVPGVVITADDGRGQKSLTLEDIRITSADAGTNIVRGTTPGPERQVRVALFTQNGGTQVGSPITVLSDARGNWGAVLPAALVGGNYVIADMPEAPPGGDGDRSRADFAVPAAPTPTNATVTLTGDAAATAGAASVALSSITVDAIRGAQGGGPSGAPLGGIPLGGIPLGGIPLGGIPLGGIPLGGIPLGGIPLGGIGFTAADLRQNGLGGVPLSTIPLKAPDSWQARLDANDPTRGTPAQSTTLAQVLGTPVVNGVTLQDIDLAGSPLGGIPLGGIALGGMPLGGIPLGGIAGTTTAQNLTAWCAYIASQPGFTCTDPTTLGTQTMIGLALAGVPLGGIPLGGIPLGGIDLDGTPLGGIPLGGIDLDGTPLGGIPLGGIDMGASPLGGIPLGGISTAARSVILDCTAVFVCADTATLGEAKAAGAIKPDAKVQDLDGIGTILIQDFIKGLPGDTSLADLLGSILARPAYDWESLPLTTFPIQDFSSDGGVITYTAQVTPSANGAGSLGVVVAVQLQDGQRYVTDSSTFDGAAVGDPTLTSTDTGNVLSWRLDAAVNISHPLVFKARPGLHLGSQRATASVRFADTRDIPSLSAPVATSVTQSFGGNGSAANASDATTSNLYVGYTPNGSDRDYFRLPLPAAGTQVTVHLSHLSVDDDLVVFAPAVQPLRAPTPAAPGTLAPGVAPDLQQRTQAIPPEALSDVPTTPPPGAAVIGLSDNRGLADEEVTFIAPEHAPGAVATIQVSSFDGGWSNDPWILRVEQSPPLPLPAACTGPTTVGGGSSMTMPSSVGGSTLYLFNAKRFGDIYGATAESSVWSKLTGLAARTDAAGGTVVPIDSAPGVGPALTSWYANACSPGASNDVVRAIGAYLDTIPSTYKYVVLVGGYDVLPPGLVLDNTSYVNERDYATTFLGATNNAYLAAYSLGYLPTDDPYGDTSYSGTGAYIPEASVGRLVETPDQIKAQVDQYVTRSGAVAPTTALVTGYDFLADGAHAISSSLQAGRVPAPAELIREDWTRADLLAALFPATSPPAIDSINAHFDHYRSLPADQNAAHLENDLFTTGDVTSASGRIVITMGCHSGVPVADTILGSALNADWAQAWSAQGAISYIANTGYGLGETSGVAYSERLHQLLAQRLDGSMTVGQALIYAKQEYAGSVPTTSGYQLKVLDEASLFGLPMYRVGNVAVPSSPTPAPVVTDAATGLLSAPFNVSPAVTLANGPNGSYYTVSGNAAYEDRRPIEPLSQRDVTEPGLVAHGALITSLASSDQTGFDAAFSRVVEDSSALSPELVGDISYPSKLQSITTFSDPTGARQRLLLFAGQFRSDGVPDAQGIGTQRLFSNLSGTVLYAGPSVTDFTPPAYGPVTVDAPAPSTIGFATDVTDNGTVKRVLALYRDASGTWRSIDLARGTTNRWSGAGPLTGTQAEWFIQAVDAAGNVGVTSNKATVASTVTPPPTGSLAAQLTGPSANGWFTGDVSVALSGGPGITSSLDGAPFTPATSLTVSGTGVHTVDFQATDGSHGSVSVPIDTTPPTVSIPSGIISAGTPVQVVCADAGSGVASCATTPSTLDLSVGLHSVHVVATDRVGNVTTADGSYTVDSFTGFLSPVNNLPVVNVAKAGSAVPVKFSLKVNLGLGILLPGYPQVRAVDCASGTVEDIVEQTVTAGGSSLQYDAASDTYTYVWKTSTAWAGTCRQFDLRLTDGTQHRAMFRFK